MKEILNRSLLITTAIAALGFMTPVLAQTTDGSAADGVDEGAGSITDIVVMARRREESSQDVPISITALSGEELQRKGLRSTEDLRTSVPSLNIAGQRRDDAQFFIRGQGPGVIQTLQRNFTSVATYFAEVPTAVAGPGVFYDIGSVQVLKGPQGTLFGRNTTGGAVLFEPNRPSNETEAYAQVTAGNYHYFQLEGMVNFAIAPDKLALRLAGQISRRDGFTTSDITGQKLDGRDYDAVRGSLLITPGSGFENLTIVDYRRNHSTGGSAVIRALNPGAPLSATTLSSPAVAALTGIPLGTVFPIRTGGRVSIGCLSAALPGCPTGPFGNAIAAYDAAYNAGNPTDVTNGGFFLVASTAEQLAILARQQALGPRRNLSPSLLFNDTLDWGITNKTIWQVSDTLTLKNIVAFRKSRQDQTADFDGTPLNFLENLPITDQKWGVGTEQFTEEFQVQGNIPSADVEYIVGYYHEQTKPGFVMEGKGNTLGTISFRRADNKDVSNAIFAHLEWNPLDIVGVSGGIRKTWDTREASLSFQNSSGDCIQADPLTNLITCPIGSRQKFSATTYDVTINLKPTRGVLLFGSFRHGFKSGGINLPAPPAPPPNTDAYQFFGPETVNSLEVGIKADFNMGIPVRTNLSLFRDKYRNIQVSQTVLYTPAGATTPSAVPIVRNLVNAVNQGVEFETTIVPFKLLSLSGFVSYLDAAPSNTVPGVSIAGRQKLSTPKWKYGVSGVLDIPVAENLGTLSVSMDYAYQSKIFTSPTPSLIDMNPGYGLLNGRVEWRNVLKSGVDLSIFGTNLTNKTYVLGGYPVVTLGFDSAVYGEPRMFGMSAKVHF